MSTDIEYQNTNYGNHLADETHAVFLGASRQSEERVVTNGDSPGANVRYPHSSMEDSSCDSCFYSCQSTIVSKT